MAKRIQETAAKGVSKFVATTLRGKAQRVPARHFVVLDCKLMPLYNTCLLSVIYNVYAVRLVSPSAKI